MPLRAGPQCAKGSVVRLLILSTAMLIAVPAFGQPARGVRGTLAGEEPGQAVDWPARLAAPPSNKNRRADTLRSRWTSLARAAVAMGQRAARLTSDDVGALIDAARDARSRHVAAPELHTALLQVAARHPDRATRAKAQRAADRLRQDAHLVALRRTAIDMSAAGKPGVAIWVEVAKRAVDHHKDRTDLTGAQRFDAVLADLAAVLNGPEALAHLEQYEATFGILPGSDPNVDTMIRALEARDLNLAFAGKDVDPTLGADFRAGFRDATQNQVFHTNFFVLLGYAAAKHDGRIVNAVNLKHETYDHLKKGDGGSVADWRVSAAALRIGDSIRRVRDGESNNRTPREGLLAIPTLIGAAFSTQPNDYARPWGPTGPDYSKVAKGVDAHVREHMHTPFGRNFLANNVQRGLIRFVRWLR